MTLDSAMYKQTIVPIKINRYVSNICYHLWKFVIFKWVYQSNFCCLFIWWKSKCHIRNVYSEQVYLSTERGCYVNDKNSLNICKKMALADEIGLWFLIIGAPLAFISLWCLFCCYACKSLKSTRNHNAKIKILRQCRFEI